MKRFSEKLRMLQTMFGSNEIGINDILLKPYSIRDKRKLPVMAQGRSRDLPKGGNAKCASQQDTSL